MASLEQKIESLLFVAGKSLAFNKLASLLGKESREIEDAVAKLVRSYAEKNGGLRIITREKEAQMVSAPEVASTVRKMQQDEYESKLSRAALETLAIIAYRDPITRPEIDAIRGVNSSIMLRTLLMRGLVDRRKSERDARLHEYYLSFDTMKMLGIARREELSGYEDLCKKLETKDIEGQLTEQTTILSTTEKKQDNVG